MRTNLAIIATLSLCGAAAADQGDPAARPATNEVFFAFDSARLTAGAAETLGAIADELKADPEGTIVLDGHADARGGSAYNVGLSARRAEVVRDALIRRGIASERIIIGVYGEDGPRHARFALDRRVDIALTHEPLHAIITRALPVAIAVVWRQPVTVAEIEGRPIPIATR